jgi:hypothetical protein
MVVFKKKMDEDEVKYRAEVRKAIERLPEYEAVKIVVGELDCKIDEYASGYGRRRFRDVIRHKSPEIPLDLIRITLDMKGFEEAYNDIYNYELLRRALDGEKRFEGSLMELIRPSMRIEKREKSMNLMTKAVEGDKQAEEGLLKSKLRGEEQLELLRARPELLEELKSKVRKVLRSEL